MSIQIKMGMLLIVITTLVLCGFGVYQYESLRSERMDWLADFSNQVTDRLSDNLVLPIWEMDQELIEKIINSEMTNKNIAAILVLIDEEIVVAGMQRDDNWKIIPLTDKISGDYITKERSIVNGDQNLGHFNVYVTPLFVQKELKNGIQNIVITVVLLDVILFLVLSIGLRSMIILPINNLLVTACAISEGDFTQDVEIRQKDEIGRLANAFRLILNSMRETTVAAEGIACGNMDIEVRERSEKDRMMQALNRMIQRLKQIMEETNSMISSVGRGELEIRGNAEAYEGGWRELVSGMNDLIVGLSSAVIKAAALGKEMELARRIQTSLLPRLKKNMHPDFEFAAAMLPADEVGGDFYDVVYDRRGNLWLAIGDVSGHGVTPGLIMMMAQTIHATMSTGSDCDPKGAVVMTNSILYRNVHERLKESHFMTFTALKYLGQGVFQYAGAHLRMVVYRKETETCDLIKTRGVYLNFKKDISKATKNAEFVLNSGDILVLYTDGLTEAENSEGQMIGMNGFVQIVEKHAHQELETMKDLILADVRLWCNDRREDDMTILVVKRKIKNEELDR